VPVAEAGFGFSGGRCFGGGGVGATASAAGASLPSVTIWRVVVPELVSAAVWPAASGRRGTGLQLDIARWVAIRGDGREARRLRAGKNSGPSGHGVSPGSALLPGYPRSRSRESEISDRKTVIFDFRRLISVDQNIAGWTRSGGA
jgi:hypothetical protein